MSNYRYRAYNKSGTLEEGEVQAQSEQHGIEILYKRGVYPFEIRQNIPSAKPWWQYEILGSAKISSKNLALFTREMATLLKAQLPLDEVLRIVCAQLPKGKMQSFGNKLLNDVVAGEALSQALSNQNDIIPKYYISLVQAGEASGSLDDVFIQLANFIEKSYEIRAKIRSALVYPSILMAVALIALVLIAMVLIPNLAPIFEDSGANMPFIISAIVSLQSIIVKNWISIIMIVLGLIILTIWVLQSDTTKQRRDQLLLKLPVIGGLVTKTITARVARTLSVLLSNGVALIDALRIIRDVTGNDTFVRTLNTTINGIKEGQSLHDLLHKSRLFPDLSIRLIKVGEEAGKLDEMLLHTAQLFETQTQRQIDQFIALLTPALTLTLGLGIGALIMSVMTAILSVNDLAL